MYFWTRVRERERERERDSLDAFGTFVNSYARAVSIDSLLFIRRCMINAYTFIEWMCVTWRANQCWSWKRSEVDGVRRLRMHSSFPLLYISDRRMSSPLRNGAYDFLLIYAYIHIYIIYMHISYIHIHTYIHTCYFMYIVSQRTCSTYCDYDYMDPGVTIVLDTFEVFAWN